MSDDSDYHASRERQERAFATAAPSAAIRAIHSDLARRHAALTDRDDTKSTAPAGANAQTV